MLNKILPAIIIITTLIVATGSPAASNGTTPKDWTQRLEPLTTEFELEENDQVLNLPIQELDGENYLNLEMLAYLFDWTVGAGQETGVITVARADSTKTTSFELETKEFNNRQLVRPPLEEDGAIYIGPALARYLAADLENQNISYIAWLELEEQADQAAETDSEETAESDKSVSQLNYKVKLWNIADGPQTLNFMSGQTLELYLLRNGEEVWKLSDGRGYTMALQNLELKPDEIRTWNETVELPADLRGKYILTGAITAQPAIPLNQLELKVK